MKLKQLFCRHKKLTAVGIYEKVLEEYKDIETDQTFKCVRNVIVCKCNICGKEFEYDGFEIQNLKYYNIKQINIDNILDNKLWGKWWQI